MYYFEFPPGDGNRISQHVRSVPTELCHPHLPLPAGALHVLLHALKIESPLIIKLWNMEHACPRERIVLVAWIVSCCWLCRYFCIATNIFYQVLLSETHILLPAVTMRSVPVELFTPPLLSNASQSCCGADEEFGFEADNLIPIKAVWKFATHLPEKLE